MPCYKKLCMFEPEAFDSYHHTGNCTEKLYVLIFTVVPLWVLCPCHPLSPSSEYVEICCCHPGFKLHLTSLTVCIHYTTLLITDTLLLWPCWSVPLTASDHMSAVRGCMLYRLHWINFHFQPLENWRITIICLSMKHLK